MKQSKQADRSISYTWQLGQDLYTASDINLKPNQISQYDHPYAGWLYVGMQREEVLGDASAMTWGVEVGCLGLCAGGEWTQTHLHRLLQQPLPQAWSTQLRNEFGVIAKFALRPATWQFSKTMDLQPGLNARFGNIFTDLAADIQIRAGRLNQFAFEPAQYAYFRAQVKDQIYNASIQGGYFRHDEAAHKIKSGVGQIEFGYQWQQAEYGLGLAIIRRSNELRGFPNSFGAQNFARIQLSTSM